ncbi:hypothetical protein DFO66_104256 [Brevibacterium sanguinis]|uniref:Uncharacterized protein n=2 Tax=Brevibacterium TaxID=1696 RepID=A0A366IJK2_9MICO|nr:MULTISPECIES: hypothetical protein [Brevibacterium]RBP65670.1 hypothetical protein DFO66_104256 [Brevibacterium sanguinis]RBP72304.1 hypothetical protein DFO65_104262 [Brevibacterium celere]
MTVTDTHTQSSAGRPSSASTGEEAAGPVERTAAEAAPGGSGKEAADLLRFPDSLALCIIAAVFTTGSNPHAVRNVVRRYVSRHGRSDGARALQYSIAGVGGARPWAVEVVENRKPANTHPGAPLKAEVIERAVQLMVDLDIDTVPDLRAAVTESPEANPVLEGWTRLPSQSSGATYRHLLTIAGLVPEP